MIDLDLERVFYSIPHPIFSANPHLFRVAVPMGRVPHPLGRVINWSFPSTAFIGYYDYLGTQPKNSHWPIIVTGR